MADNSLLPSTGNAGLSVKATPTGADSVYIVDAADTSQSAAGTSKSTTLGNIATNYLASATQTLTNKTYDTAGTGNVFKINGTVISAITGSGSVVLATSPTLVTPTLGAATATTINKVTITAPATAATLTLINNTTVTGPASTDTLVGRATTDILTNKTLTSPVINVGSDAQGDIYYRNGSGNFTRLAPGTTGQVLQTKGASANPVWATMGQAVYTETVDNSTFTGSYVTIAHGTFTLTSASIVMIIASCDVRDASGDTVQFQLLDGVSALTTNGTLIGVGNSSQRFVGLCTYAASFAAGAHTINFQGKNQSSSNTITVGQTQISIVAFPG